MTYPIQPSDIQADIHFWGAFGKLEAEVSARHLVRMAQRNGDWRDFTQSDIDKFSDQSFHFNGLLDKRPDGALIKTNDDRTFSFTHKFIVQCFLVRPVDEEVRPPA